MKNLLFSAFVLIGLLANAQQRIDGTFPFQTDPNKKYSLYIPSGYVAGTANNLMLGFHPLNTSRWNAKSWCDTLIVFAETNNLILVCPDGGLDGKVDDAIDTAFTTVLLDSVASWYTINHKRKYIMGFSWGGLTTYKYGLSNTNVFGGFMPIGAAINGTNPINGIISNANNKAFYVVHGGSDSPGTRYTPLINGLTNNGAILNTILMPGVGHTIDFPNRNQILTTAYLWLDSVRTTQLSNVSIAEDKLEIKVFPNQLASDVAAVTLVVPGTWVGQTVYVLDISGHLLTEQKVEGVKTKIVIPARSGQYLVIIEKGETRVVSKIFRL